MNYNQIIQGDSLSILKTLPTESVNCCVTSPPYWNLRDYGVEGQLGLEKTFEEYINKLCDIFDEVKRVLRKDGTCWVNLGDTYGGSGGDSGKIIGNQRKGSHGIDTRPVGISGLEGNTKLTKGYEKSLLLIPQRFAIEMVNRGWICRNTIIWHKPNCMPSSAKDRFTVDFEYVYFFVKSKKYWFEQQFEELQESTKNDKRTINGYNNIRGRSWDKDPNSMFGKMGSMKVNPQGRNKRAVWTIPTKPFPEAHFAVYPETLIEPMIQAGCPRYVCKKCGKARVKIIDNSERINTRPGNNVLNAKSGKEIDPNKELHKSDLSKYRQQIKYKELGYTDCHCNAGFEPGVTLDPFCGSGTTLKVAKKQGKRYIGIEIKQEYIDMANKGIRKIGELLF